MTIQRPPKPTSPHSKPLAGRREKETAVSHDVAKRIIESRPLPTNIYRPKSAEASEANGVVMNVIASGYAGGTVPGAPHLTELARALKNDVDLIFEFVYNNIEFLPTYGTQKGALGCLIDGMGNSFDQSELMIELLRLSGYTASYQFGELELSLADASAWLGTDSTNINAASSLLNEGFIPNSIFFNGVTNVLRMSHCFVKVTISGTNYVFDPAKKTYSAITGMNLATALSYSQSTFMSNATSGATINSNYVQNLNRANIRSNLGTFTTNLINYIKANKPDATLEDVIGGKTIVPVVGPVRNTSLSYLRPGTTPTTWSTDIPTSYYATLHVMYDDPNIDVTFYSKDIHTKRLTLTFNGSLECELRLDGTLIATSSAQSPGSWNSVLLEAVHPYATTGADSSFWMTIWADHPYLIAQAWGNAGPQMIQLHQEKLKQARFDGGTADSEAVIGSAFATTWHVWNAQNNRASDIINKLSSCRTMYHSQIGIFGHFDTVYEDLPGVSWKTAALDNDWDNVKINDNAMAMHGIAFEAAVIQQMVGIGGVSTTTVIDIANSAGDKIYDASSSNWLGTVRPALTNYSTGALDNIENWWINAGWRVAVPEDGAQPKDDWTGFAYYAISPTQGTIGIIDGSLKGGTGAAAVTTGNYENVAVVGTKDIEKEVSVGHFGSTSVDLASGQYTGGSTDLTLGSAAYPYGLSFGRSYKSNQRLDNAGLGLGWSHNHQMSIAKYSNGLLTLADQTPIQGAAGIVELFVAVDLQTDLTKPMDKWIVSAIANQWLIDNVTDNVMAVNTAGEKSEHVLLPDGTYARPKGGASKLTDNHDGTFTLKTPQQVAYNFNSSGNIATIVYPEGVTITYTYSSGLLSTVTNGLGRTLTFNWTSGKLTSVSDGTGRSVSLTIDASNNLTGVTDPNSKTTTYSYVSSGLLLSIFRPANPSSAVITNTYDALNRIKQQTDAYSNAWTYYLAGSRSEEIDPASNSSVSYLNRSGLPLKTTNQVGKVTTNIWDGLDRLKQTTLPEGNSTVYTYDDNNNVLTATAKAKSGSGLSDIVKIFTYNSTWNKVATAQDGRGNTNTYTWNATTGTLTKLERPVIGGFTPTISFTYNSRGQPITKTDETGMVTQLNYHVTLERVESVVTDFGVGKLNLTVSFSYDSVGNITSLTDPRGKISSAQYDNLRRLTQTTSPAPFSYISKITFNENGARTKVENQTSDPGNPWQTSTATYFIDDLLASVTSPSNETTTFVYTNLRQLWKITDPASRVVERTYDAVGRPYTVKDPALDIASTMLYTDNGLLASVKDVNNNTTSFDFDGFDRPNKTIFADSSYEQNTNYDANGNILTIRLRSGNTVTNTYDVLDRLSTKAPTSMPTITNTYDLANRLTKVSTPTVGGDPTSGDFEYFFDTAGRFYKEKYPDAKEVIYQLDANGNATRLTYPDGYYVERVFDELNRLTDIKLNGSSTASLHFDFDAQSRRTKLTYGNGVSSCHYGFEKDNDLTSLINVFNGSSVTFTHKFNNVGELTGYAASDSQYIWHPSSGGTGSYGTANNINQYPTVNGISQSYNTNGCLTGDGTWTYSYNTLNHLISASKSGVSASYLYDPNHRQGQKTVGSIKTRYIYTGFQRIAEYDGTSGALLNRFVYGMDLDEPLIQITAGGSVSYFHNDLSGSIVGITDSSGSVLNRYKYSPYGESAILSGTTFGFQGQRYDSETGLYYMKLRYFDPKTGRFLQPDPVGFLGGLNFYSFGSNSPTNYSDSFGLSDGFTSARYIINPFVVAQGTIDIPFAGKFSWELVTPFAHAGIVFMNHKGIGTAVNYVPNGVGLIGKVDPGVTAESLLANHMFMSDEVALKEGVDLAEFAAAMIKDAKHSEFFPYWPTPGFLGKGFTSNAVLGWSMRKNGALTTESLKASPVSGPMGIPYINGIGSMPGNGAPGGDGGSGTGGTGSGGSSGGSSSGGSSSSVSGQIKNFGKAPPLNESLEATQDDGKFVHLKIIPKGAFGTKKI